LSPIFRHRFEHIFECARNSAIAVQGTEEHALDVHVIRQLTANNHPQLTYGNRFIFGLKPNVILHTMVLGQLGIDIYANRNYDTWVIQIFITRLETNSSGGPKCGRFLRGIQPNHSFMNHSSAPNAIVASLGGSGN
jgi:hypothetical protein